KEGLETLLKPEGDFSGVQFRTAAMKMQLIKDVGQSVFVRFDAESERLLDQLQNVGPYRELMRKLQRYTVNVPQFRFDQLLNNGDIQVIRDEFYVQTSDVLYHKGLGLLLDGEAVSPDQLIVGGI
ncbi:MAG: CRISPR-associated helicase/endonuclease Cas3, partial [Zetaproteobacteria bacterium CG12_big_fil_rev_8_21_14_0_65_54_13]